MPALAECLTLNKADFVRTGPRGATYLAYRKAIQEAVSAAARAVGRDVEAPAEVAAAPHPADRARPESRAGGLAEEFPLLAALVDHRPGGQKRLPLGGAEAYAAGLRPW